VSADVSAIDGSYTRALGSYIAGSHGAELPTEVIDTIKLLTLDALGCGIVGAQTPWTERLRATLAHTEAPGPSLAWCSDVRLSPANAAMVNGTAVHGFELDDVGPGGHFGPVTVTVALALAEAQGAVPGADLIRATVAGIEVAARVSACVGRVPHAVCGFHGPGLLGAFAAMTVGSYLLDLDAGQAVHAIGHVAQFTGGLMGSHHGGMGKRLLAGKAAHSGTLAAQLARHGFTNVDNIFECGYGSFPSTFSGGRDTFDLGKLTDGLGEDYRSTQLTFKMWACRMPIHPFLEAMKDLRAQRELPAEEIAAVQINLPEGAYRAVGFDYVPASIATAQLNLQYCLAIMLLENDVFVDQFTEEKIAAPEVMDLVSRISVRHDPALDGRPSLITHSGTIVDEAVIQIKLHGGEEIVATGTLRGSGSDQITPEDVIAKFRRLADGRLPQHGQDALIEKCLKLDELADARELLGFLQ
jgi:aconitate decarboxylase